MIFLGAGASAILGIKTMQDLTNDLVGTMRNLGYNEIIDQIIRSLNRFDITPDFEAIYTTLEALVAPDLAVKSSGAFAAYVANTLKGFEEIRANEEIDEILFKFRKLIYDSCTVKPGAIEEHKSTFDELFSICSHHSENRRLSNTTGFTGGPNSGTGVPVGHTIATTNYDMSMELYHRLLQIPLIDGFKLTNDPFVKELDPAHYSGYGNNPRERWLIKLHGSIWQFRQGERIIKTIEDPLKSSLDIKVDEQMMIYPVGEKPILKDPYYTFYEILKEQRWTKMIVIGYSFRDDPVNLAIVENLEKVKNATLIVINPRAERVIENLGPWARTFNNRLIRISKRLDDKDVFQRLILALKVESWERYQKREWEEFKDTIRRTTRP